jgi:hypothetical protein
MVFGLLAVFAGMLFNRVGTLISFGNRLVTCQSSKFLRLFQRSSVLFLFLFFLSINNFL